MGLSHSPVDKVGTLLVIIIEYLIFSDNPVILPWPAGIDTATVMVLSSSQGEPGIKWAFKLIQQC